MKPGYIAATLLGCVAASAFGQGQPVAQKSLQAWEDPAQPAVLAKCKNPAPAFKLPPMPAVVSAATPAAVAPPPSVSVAIPGVIEAGKTWKVVWQGEGNNADGPIATDDGGLLFARNDRSDVLKIDASGRESIVHKDTRTGGSLSRNAKGDLFVVARGLNPSILQLEPQRKVLAGTFRGEPLDCVGGILNDLSADRKGGAYFTLGGLYYASATGVITQYGKDLRTNGVILSPDEKALYVTNGPTVAAFDVGDDGSLKNQREFARLSSGNGDGSTVDAEGRLYVSTGRNVDVFAKDGKLLGTIPGPEGLHGVAFSGADKKTLYAVVLTGFMTPNRKSTVIAIPTLAQGYKGRAK